MRLTLHALLIALLFFLITMPVNGQKPKLGLVLSGGGAKGIAHVSVLKAMEEAGLRPDYITGTSMGGIIGGLYATGYSAAQIEEIILSIDWDQILSNNIPLNYISYEEKEYYNRFLVELPVRRGHIELPSGVIEGQMLSEALNHFTWPAVKYDHFDSLPIPFRCIGTDVSTGKEIIFEDGSLAEALRASMAIPTAFSAADLDSTLAVDGGVVNNFPADVLKEMGADIIIGVNVNKGFQSADEVGSLAGILMQMAMITSNEKLPEQAAMCDVYIQPDLSEYTTASFSKYNEILEVGRVWASYHKEDLDSLARLFGKREPYTGIVFDGESIVLSDIEFAGNSLFNDDVINGKLGLEKGDTVSLDDVEEGVRRVYGINGFYKVEYRMRQDDENKGMSLKLKMKEKPPITLRSAFHYDNTFSAGIILNIQVRDLLFQNSRAIVAGDIAENPRFRFDYYKYIGGKKKAALNVRYDYHREQLPVYEKGEKTDVQTNVEHSLRAGILATQSLKSSTFLYYNYESNRFRSDFNFLFTDAVDKAIFNLGRFRFGHNRNYLNNQNYPTKGAERFFLLDVYNFNEYRLAYIKGTDTLRYPVGDTVIPISESEFNSLLKEQTPSLYSSLYMRNLDYWQIHRNFQLVTKLNAGLTLSADSAGNLFNTFSVGGNQRVKLTDTEFFGYNYREVEFENFIMAGFYLQNVILKNFFLRYGVNAMVYEGHVPVSKYSRYQPNNILDDRFLMGYGGLITYKSFIGPISFGMSSNIDDGYVRYYLSLGYSMNYAD